MPSSAIFRDVKRKIKALPHFKKAAQGFFCLSLPKRRNTGGAQCAGNLFIVQEQSVIFGPRVEELVKVIHIPPEQRPADAARKFDGDERTRPLRGAEVRRIGAYGNEVFPHRIQPRTDAFQHRGRQCGGVQRDLFCPFRLLLPVVCLLRRFGGGSAVLMQ